MCPAWASKYVGRVVMSQFQTWFVPFADDGATDARISSCAAARH